MNENDDKYSRDTSYINVPKSPYTAPTSHTHAFDKHKCETQTIMFMMVLGLLAMIAMPIKYIVDQYFTAREANDDIDKE